MCPKYGGRILERDQVVSSILRCIDESSGALGDVVWSGFVVICLAEENSLKGVCLALRGSPGGERNNLPARKRSLDMGIYLSHGVKPFFHISEIEFVPSATFMSPCDGTIRLNVDYRIFPIAIFVGIFAATPRQPIPHPPELAPYAGFFYR